MRSLTVLSCFLLAGCYHSLHNTSGRYFGSSESTANALIGQGNLDSSVNPGRVAMAHGPNLNPYAAIASVSTEKDPAARREALDAVVAVSANNGYVGAGYGYGEFGRAKPQRGLIRNKTQHPLKIKILRLTDAATAQGAPPEHLTGEILLPVDEYVWHDLMPGSYRFETLNPQGQAVSKTIEVDWQDHDTSVYVPGGWKRVGWEVEFRSW